MADKIDKAQLWADWTRSNFTLPDDLSDDDDAEEAVNEMAAFACDYADAMLDEYEERFGGGKKTRRRRKRNEEEEKER